MSAGFVIPDWMVPEEPTKPVEVDPYRIEALVNRFIAAKQEALFSAPDAYYRTTGVDAVDGASAIAQRLQDLRAATLDHARDDSERAALGDRLDAHIAEASDGIDRHVAAQRDAFKRQTLAERQALILRATELEHSNDDKLAGLAEANASAASELARLKGEPEGPAIDAARSAIWRAAIDQRLASGNGPQALALFERLKDRLALADHRSLEMPLQVARWDQAADQWIQGQTAIDGLPLQARLGSEPDLPLDAKLIARAKLDARESAQEARRVTAVRELDDHAGVAAGIVATSPGAYRRGTFFRIADAYDAVGEPERAAFARRMGAREAFLLPFAQASVEKQQRMIQALPDGELRDAVLAIQRDQARAFAGDPFAAATTLYPEVGEPVPIDDVQGRIRQAQQISYLRGVPVAPFTVRDVEEMQPQSGEATGVRVGTDEPEPASAEPGAGTELQTANGPIEENLHQHTIDPNIILVAGDDKEKRPRIPGSGNRPRFGRGDDAFEPKQIDPFAGGAGGRGLRGLGVQRSPVKRTTPAVEPGASGSYELSPQEKQRRAEQLERNVANAKAWEQKEEAKYRKIRPDVGTQITVQTPTGTRGRIDIVTRDSEGRIECIECKASETAPVRDKQQLFFDDLKEFGGTIMGKGKPTFEGGLPIPPTPMQIDRKRR